MTIDCLEPNQIILATGGYDHTIKLWQTHTGMCLRTLQHSESQVNSMEISPDKSLLAVGSYQNIYMYDLVKNNPNPVNTLEGNAKNVTDLGFQEDGKFVFASGEDWGTRIWDLRSGKQHAIKEYDVKAPNTCICLHPNQVELFVGTQTGVILKWDLRTDHNEQLIPDGDAMILDISIDRFGRRMAAVNNKGICYMWSLQSDADLPTKMLPERKFLAHQRFALKCKFSPDGQYLATTSADQTARIWSTSHESTEGLELQRANQRWVWDAAFSADSQYIFTASSDSVAKLWNVKTGNIEREYTGHQKAITALAFKENI